MRQIWFVVLSASLLTGCATIVEGVRQDITVTTTPDGASCALNRAGASIATITSTPATVNILKTRDDIEIVCELDGYLKTARIDESGTAAVVFGNILIGGAIGLVVDISTGASNKYDSALEIALPPDPSLPAPLPVVASAPLAPPPPEPAALAPLAPSLPPAAPAHAYVMQSTAATVDLRRAENAAERYRVLHRLVADGLVPEDRYTAWAQQNEGAFLLITEAPPLVAVGNKPPGYEELSAFLRSVGAEKNAKVAVAEREALFRVLMPMEGIRAQPQKPPADLDGLRKWYAFLDRVGEEGLVPAQSVEAEKTAIDGARLVAVQ